MALEYTIRALPDHKGFTKPKAIGDEYMVDVALDITSHVAAGAEITATSLGLKTIHAVLITGYEGRAFSANVLIGAGGATPDVAGNYESATSFKVVVTNLDGTNATAAANDADVGCALRLRVFGSL